MSMWKKSVFAIAFSFLFLFSTFGYAALTDDLVVQGTGLLPGQEGLYITDVEIAAGSGGELAAKTFLDTTLGSSIAIGAGESFVFDITVYNSTNVEYGYDAVTRPATDGTNQVYTNEEIGFRLHGLVRPHVHDGEMIEGVTRIAGGASYTFQLEFYHTEPSAADLDEALSSVLHFVFKPFQEIDPDQTTAAVEGALEKFKKILNTPYEYQALIDEMADNYSGGWGGSTNTLTYVGNVAGSKAEDTETLELLFDGQLKINLDGKDTDVTVMVKRENVDGDESTGCSYSYTSWGSERTVNGCEMTLYMTSAQYKDENGNWLLSNGDDVIVYAAVFTRQGDGEWYQVGGMYKGETTVNGYEAPWYSGSGSFNTDNWRALETYYGVTAGSNATIERITAAYLASLGA
ncbi:MAG: hypothetical protein IJY20_01485 [Clostridia bacterium]|nr:hypothetical protein [Clostridia bacterium]